MLLADSNLEALPVPRLVALASNCRLLVEGHCSLGYRVEFDIPECRVRSVKRILSTDRNLGGLQAKRCVLSLETYRASWQLEPNSWFKRLLGSLE